MPSLIDDDDIFQDEKIERAEQYRIDQIILTAISAFSLFVYLATSKSLLKTHIKKMHS